MKHPSPVYFKDAKITVVFFTIWQQKVFPYFIKETGQYCPIQAETTATTTVVGSSSHNLTGVTPNRKRKQSSTPPSLTPASKTLRLDLEDVSEEPSDEEMDERIRNILQVRTRMRAYMHVRSCVYACMCTDYAYA